MKYILASISFWKIVCAFDVQVFVYTCAPLSDEFETTDSKPGFGHQNQFCVVLRSVLFLQKTLSNGDDDLIGFFDFFTIEKREFLQHVFLYVAPQSAINRISTSTPRSTLYYHFIQTPLLCQQYISMSHTYQYRKHITSLQSTINPITRYPSYTKISFYATSFPHRFHATPTTLERCAPPATILPVSSQLDLRFNSTELFKIIARAVLLSQLNCIFQAINHNACLAQRYFQKLLLTIHTVWFIHRYSQSNGYAPKLRPTTRLFPVPPTNRLLCTSVSCKSSTVVHFLYGAFSKRIVLWLLRLIMWVLHISIMSATPLE